MKMSEITLEDIKQSVGYSSDDMNSLIDGVYLPAARSYIYGYTRLTPEEADAHEDLTTALLCLAGDMFENRYMAVENNTLNPTVEQILTLYAKNHVGGAVDESV